VTTVRVKCFSVVRDAVGAGLVEVAADPPTIRGVLDTLLRTYGEPLKQVLVDPETSEMTPFLLVLNGEAVSSTLDRDRPVNTGDELTLIFPIGGGCS
jgi:molybdopterin converting factor small subunit